MASQPSLPVAHAPPPTKISVLISGSGTNLQALIDAATTTLLPATTIVRVISNRKNVVGLTRAEKAGIPTAYHNLIFGQYHKKGETDAAVIADARQRYDADLAELVLEDTPDLVVCAGWMHILAPSFLEPLGQAHVPVINLHPALPGKYDGAGAIRRAWQDFQSGKLEGGRTGAMIHYVISEVDRGEPILVREVECIEGESLEELEGRIHDVEHEIIVKGTGLAIVELWRKRNKGS
jgi:phosphoribosylglycinamide formyltransferase